MDHGHDLVPVSTMAVMADGLMVGQHLLKALYSLQCVRKCAVELSSGL